MHMLPLDLPCTVLHTETKETKCATRNDTTRKCSIKREREIVVEENPRKRMRSFMSTSSMQSNYSCIEELGTDIDEHKEMNMARQSEMFMNEIESDTEMDQ